jgi:hypothetical protein
VVQASPGKKVHKTPSQQKELGVVAYTCHTSYGGRHKSAWVERPYIKNNKGKKGWRYGSIRRAPVEQVQSPDF